MPSWLPPRARPRPICKSSATSDNRSSRRPSAPLPSAAGPPRSSSPPSREPVQAGSPDPAVGCPQGWSGLALRRAPTSCCRALVTRIGCVTLRLSRTGRCEVLGNQQTPPDAVCSRG
jgi:hypothetical protein